MYDWKNRQCIDLSQGGHAAGLRKETTGAGNSNLPVYKKNNFHTSGSF